MLIIIGGCLLVIALGQFIYNFINIDYVRSKDWWRIIWLIILAIVIFALDSRLPRSSDVEPTQSSRADVHVPGSR